MLKEIVSSLGTAVDDSWREKYYDSQALPEIACEELQRADLASKLSYEDVLASVMAMTTLQESYDKFSNFAQTLWRGTHFYIECLLWLDSTTSKHQHGFTGAFQVIDGTSCHSTFRFARSEHINDRMEVGSVGWLDTEILRKGDIQEIIGGEKYIHSLYHLEEPSMTLVLRTYGLPTYRPQWKYYTPSVRVDPFIQNSGIEYTLKKKVQAINVGWRCSIELGDELANQWLETCDVETAFRFLIGAARPESNEDADTWRAAVHKRLTRRWPATWPACENALESNVLSEDLALRRKKIADPEQRFVLAMLMNVPDRQTILDLVAAKFESKEPHTVIADQLLAMGVEGSGLEMQRTSAEILAHAMSGMDLPAVVDTMKEKYGAENIAKHYDLIEQNYQAFRQADRLRAFF